MADLNGKMLGRYRIMERLGAGGMAQVYRGQDTSSGSEVAIKVLYPHLTSDEGIVARFRRESQTAASLTHPHIIRILDHGAEGDLIYLVMELVQGPSLKAMLQERVGATHGSPMAVGEAAHLVATLAEALDYAHSQGVVHRDVKPSNVLLRNGHLDDPVLTDFGIARVVEATAATAGGTALGTPAYMAPEQGQGQRGEAASDVYSLGVILYELLTGRPPFDAESPYALILRHIHTPPPSPRERRPDLPRAMETVILRALAKDPVSRYPTAAAFAGAVRSSVPGEQAQGLPLQRVPVFAGGALLLVILAVFAAWRLGWLANGVQPAGGAMAAKPPPAVLTLQGAPAITDTWLDPDVPDRPAFDDGKIHLQGPSTPDRVLLRLALPNWPPNTELLTATLSLYTVPWGKDNRSATLAVYQLLRDWSEQDTTYEEPWTTPGMEAGHDFDAEPMAVIPLTDLLEHQGWLNIDISNRVRDWLGGQPNYGLAIRMTDDSYGMAHLWVYASEYDDPNLRPKFTLVYQQP